MDTSLNQTNGAFVTAAEVSKVMGVSKAYAYRIIKRLNDELSAKGYLVIQGKTSRKYFREKIYGEAET